MFTRSKSREEIKLQQGTPEVQKNLQNWKYSANEMIRINKWTNQRRGCKEFSSGSGVPDTEVQLPFLHMCVALLKFTSRAHQKFFLRPGGALHMYTPVPYTRERVGMRPN